MTGLGAPWWDAEARGALLGLTRATSPRELAHAARERVGFQTRDLIEARHLDWAAAHETVPPFVASSRKASSWARDAARAPGRSSSGRCRSGCDRVASPAPRAGGPASSIGPALRREEPGRPCPRPRAWRGQVSHPRAPVPPAAGSAARKPWMRLVSIKDWRAAPDKDEHYFHAIAL